MHRATARCRVGGRVGYVLAGDAATWVVLLRKASRRSTESVSVTLPSAGPTEGKVLLADLAAGRWEARRAGASEVVAFDVAAESGAGWFEGAAGEWTIKLSATR